jgi:arylsulfatase
MFDIPQKRNIPLVYNFAKDPKESMDIAPDSTWILPVVMSRVVEFQKTLKAEPPILLGTPDPYVPPKKEK